jgi:ligand-binding SRPBCC domain-containing protein
MTMLDTKPTHDASNTIEFARQDGNAWLLRARQRVPVSRRELFPLFSDAANLARITPPELGFDILTKLPVAMHVGALIDYRIGLYGIPMNWRTEITAWNPPVEFVDTQLRGPYAEWVHRHRFIEMTPASTLVEDFVRFRLPLGRLGGVAGPIVRRQLRRIFTFRRGAILRLIEEAGLTQGAQGSIPGR